MCWNGRQCRLKIYCSQGRVGSSPTIGTKKALALQVLFLYDVCPYGQASYHRMFKLHSVLQNPCPVKKIASISTQKVHINGNSTHIPLMGGWNFARKNAIIITMNKRRYPKWIKLQQEDLLPQSTRNKI